MPVDDDRADDPGRSRDEGSSFLRWKPVSARPGSGVEEFGHDLDRVVDTGGLPDSELSKRDAA